MRRLSILLALLGTAVSAALVIRFDAGDVFGAILRIGWAGAALLLALQGALFGLLGLAWATIQPSIRPPVLIWGRMVRDAATTCLPFSPIGGYVLGIRAVTLRGPAWTTAAAGTVVDVTAEIMAQMLFALLGVLVLMRAGSSATLTIGLTVGVALVSAIALLTRRELIGRIIGGLTIRLFGAPAPQLAMLGHQTQRLYANRARIAGAIAIHLSGWMLTGIGTWISLHLLGLAQPILPVLALEAVLDAVVAVAFVVPGALGVQEAGYIGLGGLLGIPPDLALGVSLLRRAREISWGVPILCAWQWQELRRL